jgi:tRNA threonylcarbamoyl adenosine modification protein (Sua5/YciO/YrdC/YwlC family)
MIANADVESAAAALRRGQLVVFPTETLYGIGCHALRADAVERLRAAKERGADKGIAVVIGDRAQVALLSDSVSAAAERLMERFWPGALTILLRARPGLPPPLVLDERVGVRVSAHPIARRLALAIGAPIAAPSANPGGAEPARDVATARAYFGDRVAVYLDGGTIDHPPSTLVDPGPPLRVLRAGAIPHDEIAAALG